jgi:F-type H+-transporting ATPase subunit b
LLDQYEAELARIQRTASDERDRVRTETAKLEEEILGDARNVSNQIVADGRAQIDAEVKRIRGQLERESAVMARQIASTVLGRELTP